MVTLGPRLFVSGGKDWFRTDVLTTYKEKVGEPWYNRTKIRFRAALLLEIFLYCIIRTTFDGNVIRVLSVVYEYMILQLSSDHTAAYPVANTMTSSSIFSPNKGVNLVNM